MQGVVCRASLICCAIKVARSADPDLFLMVGSVFFLFQGRSRFLRVDRIQFFSEELDLYPVFLRGRILTQVLLKGLI